MMLSLLSSLAHAFPPPSRVGEGALDDPALGRVERPAGPEVLSHPDVVAALAARGQGDPLAGYRQAVVYDAFTITSEGDPGVASSGVFFPLREWRSGPEPSEPVVERIGWLGQALSTRVAETSPVVLVPVYVTGWRQDRIPVEDRWTAVDEARILGEDVEVARAAWRVRFAAKGAPVVDALVVAVTALGGEIEAEFDQVGAVSAWVPAGAVGDLADDHSVASIHLDEAVLDDFAAGVAHPVIGFDLDGREIADLMQTQPLYDEGYEGAEHRLGLVEKEGNKVWQDHPGFENASGTKRHTNWVPGSGLNPPATVTVKSGNPHATAVASVLAGDTTKGQSIPYLVGPPEREQRSGVARESIVSGLSGITPSVFTQTAQFFAGPHPVFAVNMSAGEQTVIDCDGTHAYSQTANDLFESGTLVIAAAGNLGVDEGSCSVNPPADAIGTFAVGAYYVDPNSQADRLRDGLDEEGTPLGGSPQSPFPSGPVNDLDGRGRSVVDLAGPTYAKHAYHHEDNGCAELYRYDAQATATCGDDFGGTSAAAPTVTGALAVFHEWYRPVFGSLIDHPNKIYANLLLMGDRRMEGVDLNGDGVLDEDDDDFTREIGYDNIWGAGRMRTRRLDGHGLDGPASYTAGGICISQNEVATLPLRTLSSDVDIVKTVAWNYDHRHDQGVCHDLVTMELVREVSSGVWQSLATDDSSDNKKRVYSEGPFSNDVYGLRFTGERVTSDVEGCGTNATLVRWAWLHEDSDRESHEDLDDTRTEDLHVR